MEKPVGAIFVGKHQDWEHRPRDLRISKNFCPRGLQSLGGYCWPEKCKRRKFFFAVENPGV